MRQDVNLYQPLLRAARSPLDTRTLLKLWLLFVAALALVYAAGLWTEARTAGELRRLRADTRLVDRRLRTLESDARAHRPSPLLEAAVARARRKLAARRAALAILKGHRYGNRRGFSSILVDLGRAIVPGLWLTRIDVRRGGERLLLAGRTSRPVSVPRYIARLLPLLRHSGDPAPRFHVLVLRRVRANADLFRFVVATVPPPRRLLHGAKR